MDGLAVSSHACFFKGFRESGVGMAGSGQILRTGSVLNTDDSLRNHLSCSRADDVSTQQFVSLLFSEDFDHSVGVGDGFGSGVSEEGE